MANFKIGNTLICSVTVRDSVGVLKDPGTSMSISVIRITPGYAVLLQPAAMVDDAGDGAYHYDYDTSSLVAGNYEVNYIAVDSGRTVKEKDTFSLEP